MSPRSPNTSRYPSRPITGDARQCGGLKADDVKRQELKNENTWGCQRLQSIFVTSKMLAVTNARTTLQVARTQMYEGPTGANLSRISIRRLAIRGLLLVVVIAGQCRSLSVNGLSTYEAGRASKTQDHPGSEAPPDQQRQAQAGTAITTQDVGPHT